MCIGLLAALAVAAWRVHVEHNARRVEIAMDAGDFLTFAHAYGYDPEAFLVALRRAGLTSLAVAEELGGNINGSNHGVVYSGQQLLDQARLSPISDPGFAALLRAHRVVPDWVYVEAFDRATFFRYLRAHDSTLYRGGEDRSRLLQQFGARASGRSAGARAQAASLPDSTYSKRRALQALGHRFDLRRVHAPRARLHGDLLRLAQPSAGIPRPARRDGGRVQAHARQFRNDRGLFERSRAERQSRACAFDS